MRTGEARVDPGRGWPCIIEVCQSMSEHVRARVKPVKPLAGVLGQPRARAKPQVCRALRLPAACHVPSSSHVPLLFARPPPLLPAASHASALDLRPRFPVGHDGPLLAFVQARNAPQHLGSPPDECFPCFACFRLTPFELPSIMGTCLSRRAASNPCRVARRGARRGAPGTGTGETGPCREAWAPGAARQPTQKTT